MGEELFKARSGLIQGHLRFSCGAFQLCCFAFWHELAQALQQYAARSHHCSQEALLHGA